MHMLREWGAACLLTLALAGCVGSSSPENAPTVARAVDAATSAPAASAVVATPAPSATLAAPTALATTQPSPSAVASGPASPTAALAPTESPIPTATEPNPTETPRPVATVAATPSLVPTSAPEPSRTAAASPSPTPPAVTPTAARPAVAPELAKVQQDYSVGFMGVVTHNSPGDPVEAAREVKLAEQRMGPYSTTGCGSQDSIFLWREDTRQIYFLLVGNAGLHFDACRDFWEAYPDAWQPGDPNNDDLQAPEGRVVPRGGFGKLWRESFYGKSPNGLGFPAAPERYVVGLVQRFERATAFYFPDTRAVYVLFDGLSYPTRSGEVTQPVWLALE